MVDETTISDYGTNAPPLFRVTEEGDQTVIRAYDTNAPLWRINGKIAGGGVEVMTTEERTAITPEAGQLIYDTDLEQLYVGDGSTQGGVAVGSGGGGGATPIIESTVSGSTATITLENGAGSVIFVGVNGTTISEGDDGEVLIGSTGGGGEGTVTGIEASVSGNTATITATGSTTSVKFVGIDGTTVSEGANGEIQIGGGGGGGGEGTVTGIEASVSGNTATITATGSTTSVPLVGVGGLEISGNTNGEVELDASNKQDVIVFNSDEFEVETTQESPSEVNTFRNRLFGKVLCCCGDSITKGYYGGSTDDSKITSYSCDASGNFSLDTGSIMMSYGWRIANRNAMTFYNGGIAGSTMADVPDRNGFSVTRYTKLPANMDYLLLFFGTNDYLGTLGTISDTTNATFYGAWNVVMPYIIDQHPYTKIGLIVPYKSTADFRQAVRLVGNKWGCAVFDMMQAGTPLFYQKEASVDVDEDALTKNQTNYFEDGSHPNPAGHELLADMIETFLYTL